MNQAEVNNALEQTYEVIQEELARHFGAPISFVLLVTTNVENEGVKMATLRQVNNIGNVAALYLMNQYVEAAVDNKLEPSN